MPPNQCKNKILEYRNIRGRNNSTTKDTVRVYIHKSGSNEKKKKNPIIKTIATTIP